MAQNKYEKLNEYLNPQIEEILTEWYPDGEIVNDRFHIGGVGGEEGSSLNVALAGDKTGSWYDFATAQGGGDLISLYAHKHTLAMPEAHKRLHKQYAPPEPKITKPPAGTPEPTELLSKAQKYWTYRDESGTPMTYVLRTDTHSGKKFRQLSYDSTSGGWIFKGYPSPKPLYNLDELSKYPDKRVLVVEGEKCAEAAKALAGNRSVVTTWLSGASSVDKTDWGPLAGRDVTIWPDADHDGTGQKAAQKIAQALTPHGCQVKLVDVADVEKNKWDVADAVDEGWDLNTLQNWVKDRLVVYDHKVAVVNNGDNAQTAIVHIAPENKGLVHTGGLVGMWSQMGLQLVGGNNPSPAPNAYNIHRVLESDVLTLPDIWYDTFENSVCVKYAGQEVRKISDADIVTILRQIQGYLGMHNVKKMTVWEYIEELENTRRRNWAADWIKGLKWDGEPRIKGFFHTYAGAEESDYVSMAAINWWVSLAARIAEPGCQVDTMPVLEGKQGKGKSRLLRCIGQRLHSEIAEGKFDEKEIIRGMNGKAIVEFGELHAMKKADVAQLKSFLTRTIDTTRGLYQRTHKDIKRHCVFVGTTNEDEYFIDVTGNRRFWPIKTDKIREDKALRDRDQLFAEAYLRFENGHQWWLMPEGTEEEQSARVKSDVLSDQISELIINLDPTFRMSNLLIAMEIEPDKWSYGLQTRVGKILKQLGLRKVRIRYDGRPQWFYTRLEGTGQDLITDPT